MAIGNYREFIGNYVGSYGAGRPNASAKLFTPPFVGLV